MESSNILSDHDSERLFLPNSSKVGNRLALGVPKCDLNDRFRLFSKSSNEVRSLSNAAMSLIFDPLPRGVVAPDAIILDRIDAGVRV